MKKVEAVCPRLDDSLLFCGVVVAKESMEFRHMITGVSPTARQVNNPLGTQTSPGVWMKPAGHHKDRGIGLNFKEGLLFDNDPDDPFKNISTAAISLPDSTISGGTMCVHS